MQQLPLECLNAVQYRAFWENTENPTLLKFLNFRLSAGDLGDKKTEYNRYNNELNTISKYYVEMSEMGQEKAKWKEHFGSHGSPSTSTTLQPFVFAVGTSFVPWERPSCLSVINIQRTTLGPFVLAMGKAVLVRDCPMTTNSYMCDKAPYVSTQARMAEEKSRAEIRMLQAAQHVTIATVTTDQVQKYAKSTTTKISKKFLDARTYEESDYNYNTENNHLFLSDEKSSNVSTQDKFSPIDKSSDDEFEDDGVHVDYKIDEINSDDSGEFPNSLLGKNDTKDALTNTTRETIKPALKQKSSEKETIIGAENPFFVYEHDSNGATVNQDEKSTHKRLFSEIGDDLPSSHIMTVMEKYRAKSTTSKY
ncbi:4833_t:CDS:10, partial [Funneliformis caledonium]